MVQQPIAVFGKVVQRRDVLKEAKTPGEVSRVLTDPLEK
jgi:hypothetical protein